MEFPCPLESFSVYYAATYVHTQAPSILHYDTQQATKQGGKRLPPLSPFMEAKTAEKEGIGPLSGSPTLVAGKKIQGRRNPTEFQAWEV